MADYYNMILDEDELHWFFDHIIQKPLEYETYMIMLACRGKKLTDEEREYTKVGARGEMMREELIGYKKGISNSRMSPV
ncbi:MAG: hypothetical protein ACI4LS_09030 [Treponema sp.]